MPFKVSCIMPTMPEREELREQAIRCFWLQTYSEKELIIIPDPGTVGAKRNMGCSRALGEIIIHWDDDDWSAPMRIEEQVDHLIDSKAQIVGYHSMIFEDEEGSRWKYHGKDGYALGTSLCYWKDLWRKRPFRLVNKGEDNAFIDGIAVDSVDAGEIMIARIHSGNTSCKRSTLGANNWDQL